MTQPDPRQQVRDLIATRLHAADCGCPDFRPDGTDADDAYYRRLADAVMEMFPEVDLVREYHGPGYEIPIGRGGGYVGDVSTHTRYLLRTAQEPIAEVSA